MLCLGFQMCSIKNAFDGINQAVNMTLCITGFCLSVGGFIYSLVTNGEKFVAGSFGYFAIYSGKSIYEYGYSMVRLGMEVKKLTSENLRLEQTIDRTQELNEEYKSQNETLTANVNTLKNTNAELKTTSSNLKANLAESTTVLGTQKEQINKLEDQVNGLGVLLESSKKMVTNLILAGDDYHKFNQKFGTNLSSLDETAKDLKKYTTLLGTITNSLAKNVKEEDIQDVCVDERAVNGNAKKLKVIQNIIDRKNYAITVCGKSPASSACVRPLN